MSYEIPGRRRGTPKLLAAVGSLVCDRANVCLGYSKVPQFALTQTFKLGAGAAIRFVPCITLAKSGEDAGKVRSEVTSKSAHGLDPVLRRVGRVSLVVGLNIGKCCGCTIAASTMLLCSKSIRNLLLSFGFAYIFSISS